MPSQSTISDIRNVLQAFQEGYSKRDPKKLDEFMMLFTPDDAVEVIGTSAVDSSNEEWCIGPLPTRALIAGDWEAWGDLRLDVASARIHASGDVAWLATSGTVSQTLPLEHAYAGMGMFLQRFMQRKDEKDVDTEGELLNVILGAASALANKRQSEHYVWPIRFTANLVQSEGNWKFHQIHFSYPTVHLPQVRLS